MTITEIEPVLGPVWEDYDAGRLVPSHHQGHEFRKLVSLGDYWLCEDGSLWRGDAAPTKVVRTYYRQRTRPYVSVYVNGLRHHICLRRLMLAAFRGRPNPDQTLTAPKDGNYANCHIGNLAYEMPLYCKTPDARRLWRENAARRRGEPVDRVLTKGETATVVYMASRMKTADAIARRLCCSEAAVERALREVRQGRKGK